MISLLRKININPDHAAYHEINPSLDFRLWYHTIEKMVFEKLPDIHEAVYLMYEREDHFHE